MSASYDMPPAHRGTEYQPPDGYRDPVAAQPRGASLSPRERRASARLARAGSDLAKAAIVPASCVTSRSLTLVISIMCFFACLTTGAAYMMNQSASAWLKDIASEVTVQVEPREKVETENTVREVATFLSERVGIRHARPLSLEDSAALLEPWLGRSDALKTLPIPRLIALELDRGSPPDLAALQADIEKQFKGVTLDDHRRWQAEIRTLTRSAALGGIAVLGLVAAATIAVIVSATRSAIASNREIVEVLHFVGATDRFVAREFAKHFLNLGIRAGLVGAISATLVFLGLPMGMELLGGGTMSLVELRQVLGTGTLDAPGYLFLGIVVIVIAGLCMLTSRFSVYRILHTHP